MRRLHIVLLALAIAFSAAGTDAWAQRGGGGHGGGGGRGSGGGGGSHGGGGGGYHGGGGFHGGYGGSGFRGGYGGYRGSRGGWGYGYGFGLGWGPWAYWPSWYDGYYGWPGYSYYPDYPDYSYYPNYSSDPCYPYGPYDCRISGYGPSAHAPDPVRTGPSPVARPEKTTAPSTYSQTSTMAVANTTFVGDGKWHHFGPQPAPALRAAAPQTAPHTQASPSPQTHKVAIAEAH